MRRHAFDPVSFVFGLLFAFIAVFVLTGNTLADLYPLWVWTLPAMALGLLVVLYGVRRLVSPVTGSGVDVNEPEPDDETGGEPPGDR